MATRAVERDARAIRLVQQLARERDRSSEEREFLLQQHTRTRVVRHRKPPSTECHGAYSRHQRTGCGTNSG